MPSVSSLHLFITLDAKTFSQDSLEIYPFQKYAGKLAAVCLYILNKLFSDRKM